MFKTIIIVLASLFIIGYIVKSVIVLVKDKRRTKKGEEDNVK